MTWLTAAFLLDLFNLAFDWLPNGCCSADSRIDVQITSPTVLLKQLVSPPATDLVEAAISELSDVGAVDRKHEEALITPLGYICMALPCELRLCRLIYFGLNLGWDLVTLCVCALPYSIVLVLSKDAELRS